MICRSPYSKASNKDSCVVKSTSNLFLSMFLLHSGACYFSSLQYSQSINPRIFPVRRDLWLSPLQKPGNEDTEKYADLSKATHPGESMLKARTESGPLESQLLPSPFLWDFLLSFSLTFFFCLKWVSLEVNENFLVIFLQYFSPKRHQYIQNWSQLNW